MKPSPKRTVKAWMAMNRSMLEGTEKWDSENISFYNTYREALDCWGRKEQAFVPCTITYSLPTPRKKK